MGKILFFGPTNGFMAKVLRIWHLAFLLQFHEDEPKPARSGRLSPTGHGFRISWEPFMWVY
ncbi:hypothetical protein PR202_ga31058 [Eleusine coracana subsp. coracana]|uniref:Uncharacterized protein n=1 Tax=Eleusine coracana subsp. coracana TaxID=191504 RepID=A0AAV5DQT7_ELECO|nr:hypothetical protein PR202_ga31058 [Eleusine coracana subsp. coracana]